VLVGSSIQYVARHPSRASVAAVARGLRDGMRRLPA
jgi:hypothetical protein